MKTGMWCIFLYGNRYCSTLIFHVILFFKCSSLLLNFVIWIFGSIDKAKSCQILLSILADSLACHQRYIREINLYYIYIVDFKEKKYSLKTFKDSFKGDGRLRWISPIFPILKLQNWCSAVSLICNTSGQHV